MNRMTRNCILIASFFFAGAATAAIFDTMDSVDTLKVIAEQKTQKTDRMPAGKVETPSKDDDATPAADSATKTDSESTN